VAFAFEPASEAATTLTLNVPDDAEVVLAGNTTAMSGAKRVFATNQLSAGQTWESYKVVVKLEREGQMLTQERTLTVHGGESYELTFDFGADLQLAAK
jgi:uncharacterized protein (TIGR03000 family)